MRKGRGGKRDKEKNLKEGSGGPNAMRSSPWGCGQQRETVTGFSLPKNCTDAENRNNGRIETEGSRSREPTVGTRSSSVALYRGAR